MNELELNKYFNEFYEIYEAIVLVEVSIDHFGAFRADWEVHVSKLRFICLKYEVCEIDELENLSNLDEYDTKEFCGELKENICQEFLEKISN